MIVVSDCSSINYLVLIGRPDLLRDLYRRVVVPVGVLNELRHPDAPPAVRQWLEKEAAWFEVHQAHVPPEDTALQRLGTGEREAIALATELQADALLLDDRAARQEASRRGLEVLGTLRLLETAAEVGLVDLPTALSGLEQTSFRASKKLLQLFLERDANRKQQR